MEFECSKCGLCCKQVGKVLKQTYPQPIQSVVDEFPYKPLPDGSCEKLINGLCSVYEDRPLLCDHERAIEELDLGFSKEEWFTLNAKGCNEMIIDAKLPSSYLVKEDYL